MSEVDTQQPWLSDPQDAEVADYRAVSALAVVGLIAGLLAPVAWGHPLLLVVPLVGASLCGLALWRIAGNAPALIGRKAALVGLSLSVLCGVAAPVDRLTYWHMLDAEAEQFARHWFEFLRHHQPEKALQLENYPDSRLPLDDGLADLYAADPQWRETLDQFLARPEVRALLRLGDKAEVRYYDTELRGRMRGVERIEQVYAVTYNDAGRKTSFFIRLALQRETVRDKPGAYWWVPQVEGGARPQAMASAEDEGATGKGQTPLAGPPQA